MTFMTTLEQVFVTAITCYVVRYIFVITVGERYFNSAARRGTSRESRRTRNYVNVSLYRKEIFILKDSLAFLSLQILYDIYTNIITQL